jgi:hypothetical protein
VTGFDRANIGGDLSSKFAQDVSQYQDYQNKIKGGLGLGGISEGVIRSNTILKVTPDVSAFDQAWGTNVVARPSSFDKPPKYHLQGGRDPLASFGSRENVDLTISNLESIAASETDRGTKEDCQMVHDCLYHHMKQFKSDSDYANGSTKQLLQG